MDSVCLFAEHMPHKRMKVNAVHLHVHIMHFIFVSHSCTDVDTALAVQELHGQRFKVNHWLLRLRSSVAMTGSCMFTRATVSLAFLQGRNHGDSVARVNGPLDTYKFWLLSNQLRPVLRMHELDKG